MRKTRPPLIPGLPWETASPPQGLSELTIQVEKYCEPPP
jgi:hypothetical protein